MAYQHFGETQQPDAYIFIDYKHRLRLCAYGEAHNGEHFNSGIVEIVFDQTGVEAAQNLRRALDDFLSKHNATETMA